LKSIGPHGDFARPTINSISEFMIKNENVPFDYKAIIPKKHFGLLQPDTNQVAVLLLEKFPSVLLIILVGFFAGLWKRIKCA